MPMISDGTWRKIVKGLMECADHLIDIDLAPTQNAWKFSMSAKDAEAVDRYYDLNIVEEEEQIVVTLKEASANVEEPIIATDPPIMHCTPAKGEESIDVILRDPTPGEDASATPPSEGDDCTGCGGRGEVLYDANKATWSQCPVCDGDGVTQGDEG